MTHLRYADQPFDVQHAALLDIVRASPRLMAALRTARDLDLPDWWIVSGAIYQQVWNHLTNRLDMYGVNDIDLFYYGLNTSYAAEDRIIQHAAPLFGNQPPVEVRNQARVHLWYAQHFGTPYEPLARSQDAIDRFACRTHCVGLRLRNDDGFDLYAPFGLNDIFSFRITPNPPRDNRATHVAKAERQQALWPELTLVPWPD